MNDLKTKRNKTMNKEEFNNWIIEQGKETLDWYNNRPKDIQKLIRKYPFNHKYVIAEGAPYSISAPGTVVNVESYFEFDDKSYSLKISFLTSELTILGRLNLLKLCKKYNKPFPSEDHVQCMEVEPKYLIQI